MTCCGCCICISTSNVGVVERFGKFDRVIQPGCSAINCLTENVPGVLSLRIMILDIDVDSKTSDNALVRVKASIHYRVLPDRVHDAFYRFTDPTGQIRSFAGNVIRGQVPKHSVDEIFVVRDEMQKALKEELDGQMASYGFEIVATLIVDIDPSNEVKQSMNQINTNARLREAANYEADTNKIKLVKAAEAEAEAKRLSGVGLAEQRKAAILGLRSSVRSFSDNCKGVTDAEVMSLLMMTQYFDAIKDISATGHNRVVFMPQTTNRGLENTQSYMAAYQ